MGLFVGAVKGTVTTQYGMMWTYATWDTLDATVYAYGDLANGTNVGIASVDCAAPGASGNWTLVDYSVPDWQAIGSWDCTGGFSALHEPGTLGVVYVTYVGHVNDSASSTDRTRLQHHQVARNTGRRYGGVSSFAIAAFDVSQDRMLAAWDTTECRDYSYCQTGDVLPWAAPNGPANETEGILAFQFINGSDLPPLQPGEGAVQLVLYQPDYDGHVTQTVLYDSIAQGTPGQVYLTDDFAGSMTDDGGWRVYRPALAGTDGQQPQLLIFDLSTSPATLKTVNLSGPAFNPQLGLFTITNMGVALN
jgi:hypothetical protein